MSDHSSKSLVFAYGEPAAIVVHKSMRYLVVGDLHIGRELKLATRGVKLYGASELMADRIISLMKRYRASKLVLLGDVKDSILRPESSEARMVQAFFGRLSGLPIILVQGNHDAGLGEHPGVTKVKELVLGKVGLTHGNSLPSEELMHSDLIIAGHDHPAAMVRSYESLVLEKVWVIMNIKSREASKVYEKPNKGMRLILMPAFNDLVSGTEIGGGKLLNPLVRRGLFNIKTAKVYSISGTTVTVKPTNGRHGGA